MQLEKKTKTVEVLEGVTLTLNPEEARILLDIVGSIGGRDQSPLRTFTNEVYSKLVKTLPSAMQNTGRPFSGIVQAHPDYKPKV